MTEWAAYEENCELRFRRRARGAPRRRGGPGGTIDPSFRRERSSHDRVFVPGVPPDRSPRGPPLGDGFAGGPWDRRDRLALLRPPPGDALASSRIGRFRREVRSGRRRTRNRNGGHRRRGGDPDRQEDRRPASRTRPPTSSHFLALRFLVHGAPEHQAFGNQGRRPHRHGGRGRDPLLHPADPAGTGRSSSGARRPRPASWGLRARAAHVQRRPRQRRSGPRGASSRSSAEIIDSGAGARAAADGRIVAAGRALGRRGQRLRARPLQRERHARHELRLRRTGHDGLQRRRRRGERRGDPERRQDRRRREGVVGGAAQFGSPATTRMAPSTTSETEVGRRFPGGSRPRSNARPAIQLDWQDRGERLGV